MGREANLLEIAEALEMSPKKLERILQDASETISLSEESPYTGETLASNIIDSDGVRPDEALNNESFKNQISQALSKLDTTSALIIQLYYGIDKDRTLTLEEIAPIVGLTKERVRQIKKKAMESIHMRRLKGL
jgi:RNA polymerase primary sigma factor